MHANQPHLPAFRQIQCVHFPAADNLICLEFCHCALNASDPSPLCLCKASLVSQFRSPISHYLSYLPGRGPGLGAQGRQSSSEYSSLLGEFRPVGEMRVEIQRGNLHWDNGVGRGLPQITVKTVIDSRLLGSDWPWLRPRWALDKLTCRAGCSH